MAWAAQASDTQDIEVADYGQHTDMQGEADSGLIVGFPGYTVVVAEIFEKTTQTTDFACSLGPKSIYYYFRPSFSTHYFGVISNAIELLDDLLEEIDVEDEEDA